MRGLGLALGLLSAVAPPATACLSDVNAAYEHENTAMPLVGTSGVAWLALIAIGRLRRGLLVDGRLRPEKHHPADLTPALGCSTH